MAKKDYQNDASTLSGLHIHEDEKGRKIYYQPRKMIGYVIKDENVRSYHTYENRYIAALSAGVIVYVLAKDWNIPIWVPFVLAFGVWAVLEYRFRRIFLANLIQLHNFVPKENTPFLAGKAKQDLWRILSKIVLYPLFGILLLILLQQRQADDLEMMLGYCILALSVGMGVFNLVLLFYRNKTKA